MAATITLKTGAFDESGSNQVTLSGLRMSAHIVKAGGASMGELQLRIYGMPLSDMNRLSTLGTLPGAQPKNVISLMAGDDANGMSIVFIGTITRAWADFNGAPDVYFQVQAFTGVYEAINPVSPGSYIGSVDAATIMSNLAGQMGLTFENHGVSVILSNAYFPGTAFRQAESCARAAGIGWVMDDRTLSIWPASGTRGTTGDVPVFSPTTGMIGYPTFNSLGVVINALFNPTVKFGTQVQVQSSLTPACGTWVVRTLAYDLEAEMPNGKWFMQMLTTAPGFAVPA